MAPRADAIADYLDKMGNAQAARFAKLCLHLVPAEDLDGCSDHALASAVLSFFAFAAERQPGERKLRVFNTEQSIHGSPSQRTVLEAVGDDMPFLVDSLLAALNGQGLSILALWHPIMAVKRDSAGRCTDVAEAMRGAERQLESMIHVEFTRIASAERRAEIEGLVARVFTDVALAVRDWRPMGAKLEDVTRALTENPPPLPGAELAEAQAFLDWIGKGNFIFLGCRDYVLKDKDGRQILEMIPQSGLGLLSDPERRVVRRGADRTSLSPDLQAFIAAPTPLIITKANTRSTVHRPAHMDYIGVKRFAADGRVVGERRFVGLFTSTAYSRSVSEIPYLRRKVAQALERAGFAPDSHDGKAYLNILETFPRDELFQISDDELLETSLGILRLTERPRVKIFVRRDKFDRFVSVLVYVPRDRYDSALRQRIMEILVRAYDGRPSAYYPVFGEDPLARIHFIIGRNNTLRPEPDIAALEAEIARAARTWEDDLLDAAQAAFGESVGAQVATRGHMLFGAGYRAAFGAREALADLAVIDRMRSPLAVRSYRDDTTPPDHMRFKLYHQNAPLALSDVLPVLERLGLKVIEEQTYPLTAENGTALFIHDIDMREALGTPLDFEALKEIFEQAFLAVWSGDAESDNLNKLVLRARLPWREITILRTVVRFLRQAGITYSLEYIEEALAKNPAAAAGILRLFHARLDPNVAVARDEVVQAARVDIEHALEGVAALDEDRILRRVANVVESTLRTSFYQRTVDGSHKPALAIKLDSRALIDLPAPVPMVEIFIYSPAVEAVHLRFGKVARGGIRWSDRREDFRTEILGLVKAQRVKNAVIVPVGAKGGFFPKQISAALPRDKREIEAIRCYKIFINTLLDLTDNIVHGRIVPPKDVVRHDGDDPYLVVAADKGTATFSDIANDLALDHGFWLGDAFASGGSNGYDHKKMGITARGVWEAVKRHFRELGTDIQTTPFTVVGVGDMSGDVFGNAMLLSTQTRLVAAFDHRDIFIDPNPDPIASYAERKRLFGLPRSSWADYDKSLISKGGGVFSRSLKAVTLTPEIKALTGLPDERAAPAELIRALLTAPVDLLFFGGIGTFVKAKDETHLAVGDRANDALRVDGKDLKAKVVGEGANLGCTQRGRIEFARKGGKINTDAIDNSAGVDTSDHEVNLKILLDMAIAQGRFEKAERNRLLGDVENDVAALVLADNYRQTLALTVSEATAAADLPVHARFIDALERAGELDRVVEALPAREDMDDLVRRGLGLTRPELAVLLAYAKMTLFEDLMTSPLPDEPYFLRHLIAYFPPKIAERFADTIPAHRLKREIIATTVANAVANFGGPTLVHELTEDTGCSPEDAVRAIAVVCDAFGLEPVYAAINALDNTVAAAVQTALHRKLRTLLQTQALWLLRNDRTPLDIEATLAEFAPVITVLTQGHTDLLSPFIREQVAADCAHLSAAKVPQHLAQTVALFGPLTSAPSIAMLARTTGRAVKTVAAAYYGVSEALGLDRLLGSLDGLRIDNDWERLARDRLQDEIATRQRALVALALAASGETLGRAAVAAWADGRRAQIARVHRMITEITASGPTLAKLTVAAGELRTLAGA